MVGDSTALTLDIGLNEHARDYGIEPFNAGILGCGVTSGAEYQEKGVDAPWPLSASGPHRSSGPPSGRPTSSRTSERRHDPGRALGGVEPTYDGHWTNIEDPAYAAYVQRGSRMPMRWPARAEPRSSS